MRGLVRVVVVMLAWSLVGCTVPSPTPTPTLLSGRLVDSVWRDGTDGSTVLSGLIEWQGGPLTALHPEVGPGYVPESERAWLALNSPSGRNSPRTDVIRPFSRGDQCFFTRPNPSTRVLDGLHPDAVTPAARLDEENGKGWVSVAIEASPECVIRATFGIVVDSAAGASESFAIEVPDHKGALASDPIPTPVPVGGSTVTLSFVGETTVVSTSGAAFEAGRMRSVHADRQYVVDWT